MSLIISVWNESAGVAVCEGRVAAKIDGKYVPLEEEWSKLTRLPNGEILGITGNLRDGYAPVDSESLCDAVAGHLRPAIIHAAHSQNFRELSAFIPELLKEYANLFPWFVLNVSLLGLDDGTVRGGAWSTNGQAVVPTGPSVTWQILGTEETSKHADFLVRQGLPSVGLRNPAITGEILQGVIRCLARIHPEINDRTRVEVISAKDVRAYATLTADMITTGTLNAADVDVINLDASNIATGTLSANMVLFPDGSEISSASRVITATASPSSDTSLVTSGVGSIPGFGFTTAAAGSGDVFNFVAWLQFDGTGTFVIELWLDGTNEITQTAQGSYVLPFVFSKTGLSAGSHTFQFWVGSPSGSANILSNSYCICQRTY